MTNDRIAALQAELQSERNALAAKSQPLRDKRSAIQAQVGPLEAQINELTEQIGAIEGNELVALDKQIGSLARANGAYSLSASGNNAQTPE